jgi:hypothetical protein
LTVRIDHTHKPWLAASLAILGAAVLLYAIARAPASRGSMGGTAAGVAFGTLGFAFMIFAALLGARKKVPVWRVGRAQTWMRGHLWLGLLSLPLILFHSGFRYGHGLTALLMTLLIVVVASGVFGAALQHYLPSVITREVTMETIYEEMDHVRAQLREEAEQLVAGAAKETAVVAAAAGSSGSTAATAVSEDAAAPLRSFFERQMAPFLANPGARGGALADAARAHNAFSQLRMLVPPALHETIEDLENICEEHRQLSRQAQLHLWLHGWLLLHIPLSLALLLLGAVHAVMALRY